jgi:hypothetical protein
MPRLSIPNRIRVINLFNSDQFKNIKHKFDAVSEVAKQQNIFITPRRLRDIIKRWEIYSKKLNINKRIIKILLTDLLIGTACPKKKDKQKTQKD